MAGCESRHFCLRPGGGSKEVPSARRGRGTRRKIGGTIPGRGYWLVRGRSRVCMDVTWVTEQVGLGGGIWNARNMEELAQSGATQVLNMQIEFDDRPLAELYGVEALW